MSKMKLEWKKGDWAAYFGLMTNNLTNLLTMMGLLIFVVGIPKEIVYGRIAPAFGMAVLAASLCYAWFGLQLAKKTGRSDVTALPSGPSAPSIFTVSFMVLMPVYQQTGDFEFALQIGLVWCFVEAMILVGGSFLGDAIRQMIPRTVLLSCLSGLGLLLLAMNPMLQAFEAPTVSFVVLLLIFINWFGKKPIFARIPTGLLLLIAGTVLAWVSGLQTPEAIKASISSFGFNPPQVHIDSFLHGELREDDGGTADADIDPQHGDGHGFGALLRLLAHDRRHGPERHIGEGIDHAPGDIGHRRIGHLGRHRQIQADEAEGGDARDQEGHAQHIGGKFAALEIQRIHIAGNEGIVDGIPNTGDEENGPGRSRRYSKNIGVKIENEGTHQAEAEALPDGVAEISRQLSILYLLVCHLPTSTT